MLKNLFRKLRWRARNLERRYVDDPLTRVPEFGGRMTAEEQSLYGSEVMSNRAIADALLFGVQYVEGASVEGDIVEFGTATGRTARVLSAAMASFHSEKHLHLFDSFEGLPAVTSGVDASSLHVASGVWGPGQCRGITPSQLEEVCRPYLPADRIHVYAGWFSKTVGSLRVDTRLGLLHVDCDLYESTMDALVPLFSGRKISEGAMILFDDWNCNRASNERGERKAWADLCSRFSIEASDQGSYGWVGHRFIVHHYRAS